MEQCIICNEQAVGCHVGGVYVCNACRPVLRRKMEQIRHRDGQTSGGKGAMELREEMGLPTRPTRRSCQVPLEIWSPMEAEARRRREKTGDRVLWTDVMFEILNTWERSQNQGK